MIATRIKQIFFFLIIAVMISCGDSSTDEDKTEPIKKDTVDADNTDTTGAIETIDVEKANLFPAMKDYNKWGYQDSTGKWIIEPQFYFAKEFSDGFAFVSDGDFNWKLINEKGKDVFVFDTIEPLVIHDELSGENTVNGFSDGLLPVINDKRKIGFMNMEFKMQIPFKYDDISFFSEGVCPVYVKRDKFENNWGLIDKKGNWIIRPLLRDLWPASENRIIFYDDKLGGVMDLQGKIIFQGDYKNIFRFKEGLTFATYSDNYTDYFLIDTMGKVINKGPYESVYGLGFENGEAEVMKNGKCIIIDKTGKKIRDSKNGCQEGC